MPICVDGSSTSRRSWIWRHSTRFNHITLLIPLIYGALILCRCVRVGDMARYRKSPCRRLPDVADRRHADRYSKNTHGRRRLGCTPQALPTPWRDLAMATDLDGFHRPLLAASMQYAIRCEQVAEPERRKFIADLRSRDRGRAEARWRVDVAAYLDEPICGASSTAHSI